VGFQLFPVQFHPMPRPVRGDGFPLLNLKRVSEVLFQAEAVAFEIGGIRYGSEGVDMEVMDSVGSYGEVVSLGHMSYLHPDGDSPTIGDIRLRKGDCPGLDEILKFVKGMKIFSRGNG